MVSFEQQGTSHTSAVHSHGISRSALFTALAVDHDRNSDHRLRPHGRDDVARFQRPLPVRVNFAWKPQILPYLRALRKRTESTSGLAASTPVWWKSLDSYSLSCNVYCYRDNSLEIVSIANKHDNKFPHNNKLPFGLSFDGLQVYLVLYTVQYVGQYVIIVLFFWQRCSLKLNITKWTIYSRTSVEKRNENSRKVFIKLTSLFQHKRCAILLFKMWRHVCIKEGASNSTMSWRECTSTCWTLVISTRRWLTRKTS